VAKKKKMCRGSPRNEVVSLRIVRDGEKVKKGQGSSRKELVNSWGWHKGQ